MVVVLGAHDLGQREPTRQTFAIQRVFENGFNPQRLLNDIVILQVWSWAGQGGDAQEGTRQVQRPRGRRLGRGPETGGHGGGPGFKWVHDPVVPQSPPNRGK